MTSHASDLVHKQGLQFFGSVNASISHELKNIFAIISETAGFLNDLTQLSKQGQTFDLCLLENCSNSIAEEIERGFDTIRQMNQFAHSVDDPVKETRIHDTLALAVKLTGFLSFARKTRLEPSGTEITIDTSPFLLQTLVYRTLRALYRAMDTSAELTLTLRESEASLVTLIFSHDQAVDLTDFPDFRTADVAEVLKAAFTKSDTGLALTLPRENKDLRDKFAGG
ncbi:MAG: hypothetical protein K9K63_00410 [Desulfotignum sp.]|nr:hypothetical protein [Desulfotignum sp.]MCF8089898.1 hypothetical protein [Desulfotignum sp.]MCF8135755.1 hypothetical protein [Desulfotignum sp.]